MKTYCAFCKSERKVYSQRRTGVFHFLASLLAAILLMYVIWEDFNPKAGVFFVFFLIMSEIFVQTRWRLSVICQSCGFDPVLYLKNREISAQKVKAFIEERNAKPENILKSPLRLPTASSKPMISKPKSSLLSKQV